MNRAPFQGSYPGTAESHALKHMRIHEKVVIALIFGWAACGPISCVSSTGRGIPPVDQPHEQSSLRGPGSRLAETGHPNAAACLSACTGATYAEVSPKGDLCRCWAPGAFQYTFDYPANEAAAAYPRERWNDGIRIVRECAAKGWGWEPDETGDHLRCVQPSGEHGRNYEVPSAIPRRQDQSGRRT